jgi:hypothetical protein
MKYGGLICLSAILASFSALAQSNPVPFVNQPLVPMTLPPSGSSFTLTVNGTGFVSGSVVNWNGAPLTTTFVNGSQLTAAVPASEIASAATASVTVVSPTPGGGTSNTQYFDISSPATQVTLTGLTPYDELVNLSGGYGVSLSTWVAADFNGDGKLDLASFSNLNTANVVIQLGNGDGTFQPPLTYSTDPFSSGPLSGQIAVGDFNGDGKLDLAVSNNCLGYCPTNSTISILLGNGDGTFQAPITTPANNPWNMAVGDFNGDGKLDLVVTSYDAGGTIPLLGPDVPISVYLGNGDGTFQAGATYDVSAFSIVAGDFNGDGKLDLVYLTGQAGGSEQLVFLEGDGDGTFQTPGVSQSVPTTNPSQLVAADLNGDGKLDLLAMDNNYYGLLHLQPREIWSWLGNGDGSFQPAVGTPTLAGPSLLGVRDFNADGKLDVAYTTTSDAPPIVSEVEVLFGNGDGTFGPSGASGGYIAYGAIQGIAGDFNNDGKMDLAVGGSAPSSLTVFLQGQIPGACFSTPVPPVVPSYPLSISFPGWPVGISEGGEAVTLQNCGAAALNLSTIRFTGTNPGDFAETNNCPSSLAVSSSCQINLTFTPLASGNRTASLSVTDNVPGGTQTVVLTGIGVDFSVAPSGPSSASITAGQTATYKVAVAPVGAFNQTVALTCSGAPKMSTCSLSPNSIVLNGSTTTVTVTVTTAGSSASLMPPFGFQPAGGKIALWLAFSGLSGLVLLGSCSRKSRSERFYILALLCVLSIAAVSSGCGGGGSPSSTGTSTSGTSTGGGTPVGNYILTVAGAFTSGSATLTHSTKLTVIVQ